MIPVSGALDEAIYLKGSDTAAADQLGQGVALGGDVAVVQAQKKYESEGAVYIFIREDGVWSFPEELRLPETASGGGFGARAAVDGETIAIGAMQATGTACVFQ